MMNEISIGKNIATARTRQGLSQSQLARMLNVTPQAVSKWERGESMPDIITFQRLASVLAVNMNQLLADPSESAIKNDEVNDSNEASSDKNESPNNIETDNSDIEFTVEDEHDLDELDPERVGRFIKKKVKRIIDGTLNESLKATEDALARIVIIKDKKFKNLDFSDAKDFKGKMTASSISNCRYEGTTFTEVNIAASSIGDCSFKRANLSDGELTGTNIDDTNFVFAVLKNTKLSGCNISDCNFNNATISNAKLAGNNFEDCTFKHASFAGTALAGNNIEDCTFENADFSEARLVGNSIVDCTFNESILLNTEFSGNSFSDTVFEGDITDCTFTDCRFKHIVFKNVTFTNTSFLYENDNRYDMKKVDFISCKADNVSLSFLKSCNADVTNITQI